MTYIATNENVYCNSNGEALHGLDVTPYINNRQELVAPALTIQIGRISSLIITRFTVGLFLY